MKNLNRLVSLACCLALIAPGAFSREPADGTYDATVHTDSGSYRVPVEVEDGEVTRIHWPNGGRMHVYGAELDGTEGSGVDSDGDSVSVEIDDLEYDE